MEKLKLIDLVKKSQKGDKSALNSLVNEIYNDLYYYILKTVKDENLAADITQESCIEIITTIGVREISFDAFDASTVIAEWDAIKKTEDWNEGAGNIVIHCTDGDITVY